MKQYPFIGILILLVLALIGFAVRQESSAPSSDGKVAVAASFYSLAEFAQHVGGDLVAVTNLTSAGGEPHDFDPSARDVATLHTSKVFVYNGGGLEPWVDRVLPDLERSGVDTVNTTEGLQLLEAGASEHGEEGDREEISDPHVWLSPKLAGQQVRAIAAALVRVDPTHPDVYTRNADAYVGQLDQLHSDFQSGTSNCKRRDLVTSHAAFGYLAREYGLTVIPIAGISPDEEPSPARLAEISRVVRERGVTHIFFETLVSPALSETIAYETGAATIAIHTLEGLTEEEVAQGKSYISVQRENLAAIRTALGCL